MGSGRVAEATARSPRAPADSEDRSEALVAFAPPRRSSALESNAISSNSSSSTVKPARTVGDAAVAIRSPTTSHGPSSMSWLFRIARYADSIVSTSSLRMNSPKSTRPSPSLSQSSYSTAISLSTRPGVPSPVRSSIRTATKNSSFVMPRSSSTSKNANARSLLPRPRSSILAWIMAYIAVFHEGGGALLSAPALCREGFKTNTWSTPTHSPWWFRCEIHPSRAAFRFSSFVAPAVCASGSIGASSAAAAPGRDASNALTNPCELRNRATAPRDVPLKSPHITTGRRRVGAEVLFASAPRAVSWYSCRYSRILNDSRSRMSVELLLCGNSRCVFTKSTSPSGAEEDASAPREGRRCMSVATRSPQSLKRISRVSTTSNASSRTAVRSPSGRLPVRGVTWNVYPARRSLVAYNSAVAASACQNSCRHTHVELSRVTRSSTRVWRSSAVARSDASIAVVPSGCFTRL
mmetsp:Transcript_9420/g.40001  ORF Transcript_9420/g.40001 Transcript_9420/m.40001 type:complete len:465 (+) Transcript_9420:996-2390(+)